MSPSPRTENTRQQIVNAVLFTLDPELEELDGVPPDDDDQRIADEVADRLIGKGSTS